MDSLQPKAGQSESSPIDSSKTSKTKLLYAILVLLSLLVVLQAAGMVYFFTRSASHGRHADAYPRSHPRMQQDGPSHGSFYPAMQSYAPSSRQLSSYADPFSAGSSFMDDALTSMARMHDRMSRMMMESSLGDSFLAGGLSGPMALDLEDQGVAYVLKSDLPGLEKDQINVSVNGNLLTIQGIRKSESSSGDSGGGYYAQERSYGSFSRTVALPGPVNESAITASYKEGVLTVTLPKTKASGSSGKIAVQ